MLSKKNYIAIAKAIKDANGDLVELVQGLMDYFEDDNPNFNREKFMEALADEVEKDE